MIIVRITSVRGKREKDEEFKIALTKTVVAAELYYM